ncbi:hypothetical protein KBC55_04070 [Patescibacteria group bacterium]|nr:hypothetical protein [Patescibacteria group bacterium]
MDSVQSKFIMIDGIDGSGKSTVTRAIRDWAHTCKLQTFDLTAWCQEHGTIPRYEEVAQFDVFFTFEPTKAWAGSAVRAMITAGKDTYSGLEQAHAFSVDRLVLYRRLIIPALQAGKKVIQDRGVSTSLVYQPVMPAGPTIDEVLNLPGNKLALEHRPDDLIIMDTPANVCLKRLPSRTDGDAEQIFERIELLKTFDERYKAEWFTKIFTDQGTLMHSLNTDCSMDESKQRAISLVSTILTKC